MGCTVSDTFSGGRNDLLPSKPKPPKPGSRAAEIQAMQAQAQAAIQAAQINADAANHAADTALEGQRIAAQAGIQASQNATIGGIIGAALGAHTTSEVIKQWLPAEAGAATIQSWELAQRWATTLSMKQSGYQDVAINYALSGKSYKALFSDPQWNALQMAKQTKQDLLANVQQFGVRGPGNPYGIPLTPDDWVQLNAYKDPSEILKVDPQEAAARNAAFDKWAKDMYAQGKGIIVDIYKNPQLAGSSILTMKGQDALLDPAIAPLLQSVVGDTGGSAGSTNWGQAIEALSHGAENPMTGQVKWAMEHGLIDKYGMINAGVLQSMLPPDLLSPPNFNVYRDVSEQEKMRMMDQYNNLMQIKVDPKLIREENLGMGVKRMTKLNADGTVAASSLDGYMTNAMGESVYVSIGGNRLQDWYDRQSMIMGKGPLFPSMMAPVTESELSGRFEPGFWHGSVTAKPNAGIPGQPGVSSSNPAPKNPMPVGMIAPTMGGTGGQGGTTTQAPTTPTSGSPTAEDSSSPSGYEGAPLAAGDD